MLFNISSNYYLYCLLFIEEAFVRTSSNKLLRVRQVRKQGNKREEEEQQDATRGVFQGENLEFWNSGLEF